MCLWANFLDTPFFMEAPGFPGLLSEAALRTMLQGIICSLFDGKRYGPGSKPLVFEEFGDYTNHFLRRITRHNPCGDPWGPCSKPTRIEEGRNPIRRDD